jgi:hypothetical protein
VRCPTEQGLESLYKCSTGDLRPLQLDNFLAEQRLELCVGAQVMLLKNVEPG